MPVYDYTALDGAGRKRSGMIDAESARAARRKLRAQGVYPTRLVEAGVEVDKDAAPTRWHWRWRRLPQGEVASFTRQLATLLRAGIPLTESLNGVLEQVTRPGLRRILSRVRDRVTEGLPLSQALREHREAFSELYIAMVEAGETSGTLDLVMERLADFGEQQMAMRRKIRATMAYPLLMLTVGVGVIGFLMTYVIPRIAQIFIDYHQALPLPTVILIRVSNTIAVYWPLVLAGLAGLWLLARMVTRTSRGKRWYHRVKLRLPLLGELARWWVTARVCRTLAALLDNGVPLLTAMDVVHKLVDNVLLAEALVEARQQISEGASVSAPLARSGVFPPMVIQMISVGEQSGNLEGMLYKVAEAFEREIESRISMLTSLLEPAMILALGVFVGFVVLAVLLPIFEMSHLVH